jgi:hypothetical protein
MSHGAIAPDPKLRPPSAPFILSPTETEQVSGGTIKKTNNGPGTAPYNTPGNPEYGAT